MNWKWYRMSWKTRRFPFSKSLNRETSWCRMPLSANLAAISGSSLFALQHLTIFMSSVWNSRWKKPLLWFDINKFSVPKSSVQYALDITEIVHAQQAQKNFVQTLTKTFATLSIGLAIFDRNKQLMLFNPALIDLTALPADFLSARPNLLTAFDKLWDNQIMPETKICALEGKACHFGRGSNREDLHRNLEFTLRCNISDFWASAPRWRIGIFVWRYDCRNINVAAVLLTNWNYTANFWTI